jgi:hypothetical protein
VEPPSSSRRLPPAGVDVDGIVAADAIDRIIDGGTDLLDVAAQVNPSSSPVLSHFAHEHYTGGPVGKDGQQTLHPARRQSVDRRPTPLAQITYTCQSSARTGRRCRRSG